MRAISSENPATFERANYFTETACSSQCVPVMFMLSGKRSRGCKCNSVASSPSPQESNVACAWSKQRVIEVLSVRVAMAAMQGKPSPVTLTVLARLAR